MCSSCSVLGCLGLRDAGGKGGETYWEDIKREIAIMKKLLHPNVVRLFEVLDDPKVQYVVLPLDDSVGCLVA